MAQWVLHAVQSVVLQRCDAQECCFLVFWLGATQKRKSKQLVVPSSAVSIRLDWYTIISTTEGLWLLGWSHTSLHNMTFLFLPSKVAGRIESQGEFVGAPWIFAEQEGGGSEI